MDVCRVEICKGRSGDGFGVANSLPNAVFGDDVDKGVEAGLFGVEIDDEPFSRRGIEDDIAVVDPKAVWLTWYERNGKAEQECCEYECL